MAAVHPTLSGSTQILPRPAVETGENDTKTSRIGFSCMWGWLPPSSTAGQVSLLFLSTNPGLRHLGNRLPVLRALPRTRRPENFNAHPPSHDLFDTSRSGPVHVPPFCRGLLLLPSPRVVSTTCLSLLRLQHTIVPDRTCPHLAVFHPRRQPALTCPRNSCAFRAQGKQARAPVSCQHIQSGKRPNSWHHPPLTRARTSHNDPIRLRMH